MILKASVFLAPSAAKGGRASPWGTLADFEAKVREKGEEGKRGRRERREEMRERAVRAVGTSVLGPVLAEDSELVSFRPL